MGAWEDGYAAGWRDGQREAMTRGYSTVAPSPRGLREMDTRIMVRDTRPRKRVGKPLKGMSSALRRANAKARKKDGSFKKGWTQARVMKEAHRLRKRSR